MTQKAVSEDLYEIEVDPLLKDIVPWYLSEKKKDLSLMREALGLLKFDEVRLIAHSLKGSGGGYGFQRLSALGAELETAAQVRDSSAAVQHLDEIEKFLGRVRLK